MKRSTVRLNTKALMYAVIEKDLFNDAELARRIGVSATQVWRAKLPLDDPRHNDPGVQFIAGTLAYFGGKFEDYFYLEEAN